MMAAGLWTPRKQRATTIHQPRNRRSCYPEGGVQRVNVQVGFGQQLLELVVLRLQFTQAPRIANQHLAKP